MFRLGPLVLVILTVFGCERQPEPLPADDIPALVEQVLDADAEARTAALGRIHAGGREAAVPLLIEALAHSDRHRVARAIQALVALGDRRAVPALIDLSRPPREDPTLTPLALRAIGSLGGVEAMGYLFTLETGSDDVRIRRMAGEIRATVEGRPLAVEKTAASDVTDAKGG